MLFPAFPAAAPPPLHGMDGPRSLVEEEEGELRLVDILAGGRIERALRRPLFVLALRLLRRRRLRRRPGALFFAVLPLPGPPMICAFAALSRLQSCRRGAQAGARDPAEILLTTLLTGSFFQ